jgi:hypothetical protein
MSSRASTTTTRYDYEPARFAPVYAPAADAEVTSPPLLAAPWRRGRPDLGRPDIMHRGQTWSVSWDPLAHKRTPEETPEETTAKKDAAKKRPAAENAGAAKKDAAKKRPAAEKDAAKKDAKKDAAKKDAKKGGKKDAAKKGGKKDAAKKDAKKDTAKKGGQKGGKKDGKKDAKKDGKKGAKKDAAKKGGKKDAAKKDAKKGGKKDAAAALVAAHRAPRARLGETATEIQVLLGPRWRVHDATGGPVARP